MAEREIGVYTIRFKFSVIANQAAAWFGNPPVERDQKTITTKNRDDFHSSGYFSVHFPSNQGIATPVCELARNDIVFECAAANNNLSVCLMNPIA
ncbi:MAG: hypothetical protein ACI4PL_07970 [Faecousia sp.]